MCAGHASLTVWEKHRERAPHGSIHSILAAPSWRFLSFLLFGDAMITNKLRHYCVKPGRKKLEQQQWRRYLVFPLSAVRGAVEVSKCTRLLYSLRKVYPRASVPTILTEDEDEYPE